VLIFYVLPGLFGRCSLPDQGFATLTCDQLTAFAFGWDIYDERLRTQGSDSSFTLSREMDGIHCTGSVAL